MNTLAIETASVPDDGSPAKGRLVKGGLLFAIVVGALGASSFMPPEREARAAVPVTSAVRQQIATMSTGTDQALVVEGDSAVERNALIPISGLPVGRMAAFTEIGTSSAAYSTALRCMTQAIYYEAANEPETGKRAVAQVVINRLKHPAYPNSVCGVVYEGANAPVCQFSFTCDGSLLRTPMARQWNESRRIAAEALAGTTEPSVGTATNYHADYVVPKWAFTLGKLAQIGRHIFYRLPGRVGSESAFGDRWTGVERIPQLDFGRLRAELDARLAEETLEPVEAFVPGLTVTPDAKDRHAAHDVGGRLDTTTTWRLSIPDPADISNGYKNTISSQADAVRAAGAGIAETPAIKDPAA
ncbi:Spore cortex-lytic enzyme precursor [Tsuneonella dongtanensis]|uniref:Spore cortex-lytic enzyme n=1 Tax=Tsuneonella dongtanensis TaxID=692370 RepID=A0A1B2AFN4_9SPHN|nr:cell wall hydrolase [Tsuneonella dongtanensis]ANY20963.1 Spore cortex-lytic enzyme precursor [Tsuneonella dongtanensis]